MIYVVKNFEEGIVRESVKRPSGEATWNHYDSQTVEPLRKQYDAQLSHTCLLGVLPWKPDSLASS